MVVVVVLAVVLLLLLSKTVSFDPPDRVCVLPTVSPTADLNIILRKLYLLRIYRTASRKNFVN